MFQDLGCHKRTQRLETASGIFCTMELSLKAIKVCFEVLKSEMQPSWLCQCVPSVSAASTQTLSSLISPTKKCKIGRVCFFACGQSGDCSVSSSMDMVSGICRCERSFFPVIALGEVQPLSQ